MGGVPGFQYVIAFKVICMGDSNAVDLAQQTHLCALQSVGCMKEEETLEYRKAIPQGSTMEGLYIDDHLCFQLTSARRRLSSTSPHRPQVQKTKLRDEEIMEASRCMYERVGWNRSLHKTFDKIQDFTAWGTWVNSASGKVGAPLPRRQTIIELTLGLLNLDYVTQKTMQQALSLYTHPFMHRRILFSCFGVAFSWTSKFQPRQLKRLNRSVVDELIFAVLLLPLAESCIRWPISTEVCARDATPVRGALSLLGA